MVSRETVQGSWLASSTDYLSHKNNMYLWWAIAPIMTIDFSLSLQKSEMVAGGFHKLFKICREKDLDKVLYYLSMCARLNNLLWKFVVWEWVIIIPLTPKMSKYQIRGNKIIQKLLSFFLFSVFVWVSSRIVCEGQQFSFQFLCGEFLLFRLWK